MKLLKEIEVAEMTGYSLSGLRKWRAAKFGPPFVKIGKTIRYPESDLLKFLEERTTNTSKTTIREAKRELQKQEEVDAKKEEFKVEDEFDFYV